MKRAIVVLIVLAASGVAWAQSPQGAVKPSYVQCPSDMGPYDPTKSYKEFERRMGNADNPLICREVVDKMPNGHYCQMAFICEDST